MNIEEATLKDVDEIIELSKGVSEFTVSNEVVQFWPKEVLIDCIKFNNPIFVAKENGKVSS